MNSIEYLDPETMEWTNFTPKPEGYKSRRTSTAKPLYAEGTDDLTNGHHEDLNVSIPEELEPTGCADRSAVSNGFLSHCETANVH